MKTKEKYTEILKEVVRNKAVSHDKLRQLAAKYGANKGKIQGYLRKTGVIEGMGNGVNRVLICDEEIEPHVEEILVLTKGRYKKKEKLGMSRIETDWHPNSAVHSEHIKEGRDEDLHTHARSKEAAENDIDMYSKIMEMIKAVKNEVRYYANRTPTREAVDGLESQVDTFMERVKFNINKQNEYIAELEKKVESMEILLNNEIENTVEQIIDVEKRVTSIERDIGTVGEPGKTDIYEQFSINSVLKSYNNQLESIEDILTIHDNRIQALQDEYNHKLKVDDIYIAAFAGSYRKVKITEVTNKTIEFCELGLPDFFRKLIPEFKKMIIEKC